MHDHLPLSLLTLQVLVEFHAQVQARASVVPYHTRKRGNLPIREILVIK